MVRRQSLQVVVGPFGQSDTCWRRRYRADIEQGGLLYFRLHGKNRRATTL